MEGKWEVSESVSPCQQLAKGIFPSSDFTFKKEAGGSNKKFLFFCKINQQPQARERNKMNSLWLSFFGAEVKISILFTHVKWCILIHTVLSRTGSSERGRGYWICGKQWERKIPRTLMEKSSYWQAFNGQDVIGIPQGQESIKGEMEVKANLTN